MSRAPQDLLERFSAHHGISAFNSGNAALDEHAAAFYARHGFVPTPEDPLRLYLRMKDIRAGLDSSAP